MLDSLSVRAKFLITAIIYSMIAGFLFFFLPLAYSETVYYSRENIVRIIPSKNFLLLGAAFILILGILVMLAFKRNAFMYSLSVLLFVSALICGYLSFLSITLIQNEQIIIKDFQNESLYNWKDIKKVVYEYDDRGSGEYIFTTVQDETFVIPDRVAFGFDVKRAVFQKVRENQIEFIERQKP